MIKKIILFIIICIAIQLGYSQCQVAFSGNLCQDNLIEFQGGGNGTTHKFNFNGEDSLVGNKKVMFAFASPGPKKVTYTTTINGNYCESSVLIFIQPKPVIKLRITSQVKQCFENNLICFSDSSYSSIGLKITRKYITTNDIQEFDYKNPILPAKFCYSHKDGRGVLASLTYLIEDENGCIASDTIENHTKIYSQIGPRFIRTSPKDPDCDSTQVSLSNISILPISKRKSELWTFGDGTTDTSIGKIKNHTYQGAGVYMASLKIVSTEGCQDSFVYPSVATVYPGKLKIIHSKDVVCFGNNKIEFKPEKIPLNTTKFVWSFGDPASLNSNSDQTNWITSHQFTKLGTFQVRLAWENPVCGLKVSYDTIQVLGPLSLIEMPYNRMLESEVFQCSNDNQDTVHFHNLSLFFSNDTKRDDEDSFTIFNGIKRYAFDNKQIAIKPYGYIESKNRGNDNVIRLWDFGDPYGIRCTTDTRGNIFPNSNCNFSRDSLPKHYYQSWEKIMVEKFGRKSMEKTVFKENERQCKRLLVYPSDSFLITIDSIYTIPLGKATVLDTLLPGKGSRIVYLDESWFSKGCRYISNPVSITLKSGNSASVLAKNGSYLAYLGPKKLQLNAGDKIWTEDTVIFNFTISTNRDTLPFEFLKLRNNYGQFPTVIAAFKIKYPGTMGDDYVIDYHQFRELYYSKIPTVYTATLYQKDTAIGLACESQASKQIAIMDPKAFGFGNRLRTEGNYCFSNQKSQNGLTFILEDLKPGVTFSDVKLNYDSACSPDSFITLQNLRVGKFEVGRIYAGYAEEGNLPNQFSKSYNQNEICSTTGCVTVGVIVGNGVSQSGIKPLCSDTHWYHNLICFEKINGSFQLLSNSKNIASGVLKVCRGEPLAFCRDSSNTTHAEDVQKVIYELKTIAAKGIAGLESSETIEEYYFRNQMLKDSGNNKLYNYLIIKRNATNPIPTGKPGIWVNGKSQLTKKVDTVITAIINSWDTIADVSAVWPSFSMKMRELQMDPYAYGGKEITSMIWNGKGIVGNPLSGSLGCIDTSGFGHGIHFYLRPKPLGYRIIHFRDTSLRPLDSSEYFGKKSFGYFMKTRENGPYIASRRVFSGKSGCEEVENKMVISGFYSSLYLTDSIASKINANGLLANLNIRYWQNDPLNFGALDNYDYWRDFSGKHKEPLTKWDWSKDDDNPNVPQTLFSSGPYGMFGQGTVANPWIALGGGPNSIYYKDCGKYIMRVAMEDSAGCTDTINQNIRIAGLQSKPVTELSSPSCSFLLSIRDSSLLCDPCNVTGDTCDYIREIVVLWGDGEQTAFYRNSPSQAPIPSLFVHKYSRGQWVLLKYVVSTQLGNVDTFVKWIKVPGPRPKFVFDSFPGNVKSVRVNEPVVFRNVSDSFSKVADFTWFFGDGDISNTMDTSVQHQYAKTGTYYVFLQEYDTFTTGGVKKFCPAVYPDTPGNAAMVVIVSDQSNLNQIKQSDLVVFPNPGSNYIRILNKNVQNITVYSASGRKINVLKSDSGKFDITDYPPGTYFIEALDNDKMKIRVKWIKSTY